VDFAHYLYKEDTAIDSIDTRKRIYIFE